MLTLHVTRLLLHGVNPLNEPYKCHAPSDIRAETNSTDPAAGGRTSHRSHAAQPRRGTAVAPRRTLR